MSTIHKHGIKVDRVDPSEFLNETYPAKTRLVGLLYGDNGPPMTSTCSF